MKIKVKNQVFSAIVDFGGTMSAAAFAPLFMYFRNAGEVHFREIAPTMIGFMVIGATLFILLFFWTKNAAKAGLIAIVFLLVLLNYAYIERGIQIVFPALRYWHIAPIQLLVMLQIAWIIGKRLPVDLCEIITPVLGIVFAFLILINGVTAVPSIITRSRAESEAKRLSAETVETDSSMPDFYFILFDEFSTIPFMQKHYDYDNSQLLEQLEELGFNISQSGHNETNSTSHVTANLFQMDYVAKWGVTSAEECFALRSNNAVFPLLRAEGYRITAPIRASFYGLEQEMQSGGWDSAKTITGETSSEILIHNTIVYPLLNFNDIYFEDAAETLNALSYLKDPSHFSGSGLFILAHLTLPHEPFYFDENGNINDTITTNWKDQKYYLNQYRFASDQMLEIARSITVNDPNAVIWLLSDHGARASSDRDLYMNVFPMEDMTNFFNAVYYQGETLDIEGLSGVNTMRLIMNKLVGTSYEMLPLPEMG